MDEKYANGVANEGFTEPGTKGSMGTLDSYAADKSSIGTTATGTTTAGVAPSTVGSQAKLVKQAEAGEVPWGEDENKERGNWGGKADFLLSCLGFAVGLGNVWRFPYLCYRNGGGAFLIPYVLMLALCGLPLFYLELCFGQYASAGPVTIWTISPLFKGVGYAMVVVSALVCIYYNVLIMYILYYFFCSFTSKLPWSDCSQEWATTNCTEGAANRLGLNLTALKNMTGGNSTLNITDPYFRAKSPAEEFWERYILDVSDSIEDTGYVRWQLALCLLFAWIIIFLCLIKGVKSTGKVVYFTATFPYIVLIILLIRGATLPGADKGIIFYITPKWERLADAKVWGDAAVQIFYSLGPAWGGLLTMASYNRFHNNCYRDALIVAISNCGTSVFAGFVIFSMLGYLSHTLGVDVDKVAAQGPGLTFIAYPEGIASMPIAPFWSLMFFFMLFTLGLDSQFTMMETVISAFVDEFPEYLRPRKIQFTALVCLILFLMGIPFVTRAGIWWLTLLDWYSAGFSLMLIALCELGVIIWVYGYQRWKRDIAFMVGVSPNIYWEATWKFITPVMILGIMIFSFIQYTPVTYNNMPYPAWAEVVGWLMFGASVINIPIWMIIQIVRSGEGCSLYSIKKLLKPTSAWGPALPEHKRLREMGSQTTPENPPVVYETHI